MGWASRVGVCVACIAALVQGSDDINIPEGWRMQDRFYGFRFEVFGPKVQGVGFRKAMAAAAEEIGCFGWVQNTSAGTVVGEGRCSKTNGPRLLEWLRFGPAEAEVETVEVHVYEDTKIRLHFSHFKILEDTRQTCFREPPHQCPEFVAPATAAAATA